MARRVRGDTRFGAIVSIREYPAYSGPGMLDGLLRIPGEFIVSQSFAIQDRAPVLAQVAKVERQIAASDERGTEVERAIAIARDELVTGRTVLGNHHLTILAMGRTVRDMERCVQDATKELQNFGITTVREDMNAEPCFWAQLPGNFSYIARAAMISSRNFVGFASLHNFAVGRKEGNRWGPAISLLQTTAKPRTISISTVGRLAISRLSAPRVPARPSPCRFSCPKLCAYRPRRAAHSSTRTAAPKCSFVRSGADTRRSSQGTDGVQPVATRRLPRRSRFSTEPSALSRPAARWIRSRPRTGKDHRGRCRTDISDPPS